MPNDKSDLSVTTFDTVVVEKTKLLATLEANRDKHNSLYSAAVSGYWIEAQQVIDKKKVEFSEAATKLNAEFARQTEQVALSFERQNGEIQSYVTDHNKDKIGQSFSLQQSVNLSLNFNASWPLKFPENHLEDYDRVIDLLNYSVADKVELSSSDFDAYVRNNWTWRKSFLGTNASYIGNVVSGCMVSASGSLGMNTFTGCSFGGISFSGYNPTYINTQLSNGF